LKKNTAIRRNTSDVNFTRMNRPIDFPALIFLLLLALIFLLNASAILSKASRPKSDSDKAFDGATEEKANSVHPQVVRPFFDQPEIKVLETYQHALSPIDFGLDKPREKLIGMPGSPKNHIQHGNRLKVNLTRFDARPAHLRERSFSRKVGVFWKEVGIKGRRLKNRLARLLRSSQSVGKNVAQH
jgi:hypothetical protein